MYGEGMRCRVSGAAVLSWDNQEIELATVSRTFWIVSLSGTVEE